ncbi:glycoside hydrolase family 101 beta sandwich domain-containing protein, partial [Bifidobacterium jacchi]
FNGVTVASGKVSRGDNGKDGTESYLLPWLWDASTGKLVESANEKLYHWNTKGGTTEWTLPESWRNLASVKVYELTDQGKTNEKTVPVVNGKVSLEAAAQTPYVVTKGAERQLKVTWSTGMHATDVGFNDAKTLGTNWTVAADKSGKAAVVGTSNAVLKLTGGVKVSQKLTDLKAGKRYALYVGVDNRSGSAARVSVTSGGRTLATNSTGKSIAKNYVKAYAHSTTTTIEQGVSGSYFQNMYVWFTAPDSGDVTVVLSHDAGTDATGAAYFDDVRVLENRYAGLTLNADGTLKTLTNDFENNAQGIWPFVIGGIEGVEDNRTHLSELHAPYTQGGWDVKKMDDVLDGTWSVKTNGLTQRGALVYQTIPQNVRLEPGETYTVTFKYQAGSDDIYAFVTGDGEGNITSTTNIKKAMGKDADGTFTATVTGSVTGDSWFGIYSTTTAPDLQGTSGAAANFGGYQDFVLDDLKVERVAPSKTYTKAEAEAKLKEVTDTYGDKGAEVSAEAWTVYMRTTAQIRAKINQENAASSDFTAAYELAVALADYMKNSQGDDSSDAWDVSSDDYTVTAGSEEPTAGLPNEGPASLAQDDKDNTHWHTSWSANAVTDGTAWYQFNLTKPTTINGLRYLPRAGAANVNGKIVKYKVTLTLADGTSKDVVADGTFDTATKWQRVSFDAVSDVTKVRLTALETTGRLESEVNKYATAAELRVTTDRDVPPVEVPVDKSELQFAYDNAATLTADGYDAESWTALVKARDAAKKILDKEDATLDEVALAVENLKSAVAGLVNKEALKAEIAKAEALTEIGQGNYTDDSWAALGKALEAARSVYADKKANQVEIDTATNTLAGAVADLVAVNKEALKAEIAKAEAKVQAGQGNYTDDSWAALGKALEAARAVAKNGNADQAAVDKAAKDLNAAISGLKTNSTTPVEPNKPATKEQIEALDKAINGTSGLKQNAYTAASWKAYAEALAKAKQVLADAKAGKATQQQVADATAALQKAIAGLKAAPTGDTGDKKPGSDDKPINKKPGVADTGASILAAGVACMALAGVAGVLMASRRRSSKE